MIQSDAVWLHWGVADEPAGLAPPARDYTALFERVRAGDSAALEDLLDRAQRIARRYSEAICGRAPDSEDALQEALLRTFRHAGRIREPAAFRAWLYRTVKNACLVGRRRPAAAPRQLQSLDDVVRAVAYEPADAGPRADELLARLESSDALKKALAALPASYREAIFLRDLEGLSTREVARVLGISEANVKVRLHRAHARLKRLMDGDVGFTSPRGARAGSSRRTRTP
jgi:RNA polymerase sigma-70 factor (ECF subfamily)